MEGENRIRRVLLLRCGSCQNDLRRVFRGETQGDRVFPANVFCLIHKDRGTVLFDTGYSPQVYQNGLVSRLYCLLNPTQVEEDDLLPRRLARWGIPARAVKAVILSHGHPDHLGGLRYFPQAEVILSPGVARTLEKGSLRGLVFRNMTEGLPGKRRFLGRRAADPLLSDYFSEVFDLFGDCSVYAVGLPGHAAGQIGLYLPDRRLLLAADSAWGGEFVGRAGEMRLLPRCIQQSYRAYRDTDGRLRRLTEEHPEVRVVFSHTAAEEGEL